MPKAFNLQEAQAGKPVQLVNGKTVLFVAHIPQAKPETCTVFVEPDTGTVMLRNIQGLPKNMDTDSNRAVVMKPTKVKKFATVFWDSNAKKFETVVHDEGELANANVPVGWQQMAGTSVEYEEA
jgi:hypothetical protein